MPSQAAALFQAGIALTGQRLRTAVSSYMRDRTGQARGAAVGYAVAAGMYAAAGVFAIAACLVGVAALFRWIELKEGTFAAFGIIGGVLLALTILCAAIAAGALAPKPANIPPLTSRLRVALRGNPPKPKPAPPRPAPTSALARGPATPAIHAARPGPARSTRSAIVSRIPAGAGALMAATLIGWALARRFNTPGKPDA